MENQPSDLKWFAEAHISRPLPRLAPDGGWAAPPLGFVSLVGNCKFNYSAAQMTTHGAAWTLVLPGPYRNCRMDVWKRTSDMGIEWCFTAWIASRLAGKKLFFKCPIRPSPRVFWMSPHWWAQITLGEPDVDSEIPLHVPRRTQPK